MIPGKHDDQWGIMPGSVLAVLVGEPIAGGAVKVNYRPNLPLRELERAGIWARDHARAYAAGFWGDADSDGRPWQWDNANAVHVKLCRYADLPEVPRADAG